MTDHTVITDQHEWDALFTGAGSVSFMQDWAWGEVQKNLGYDAARVHGKSKSGTEYIAQIIKIRAKRGSMLFVPYGPLLLDQSKPYARALEHLTTYLQNLAKTESFTFIRIAPAIEHSEEMWKQVVELGFRKAPIYMHAERMWVLPVINKTDDELLTDMRKTTRYSIRKAQKEGVQIEMRTDTEALSDFWDIYEETATREDFNPFSKEFIEYEFDAFRQNNNAEFFFARHQNKITAGALIIYTKTGAFYHQGASTHSKVPSAYLLQWEAIRAAKKRGCSVYNFWGIMQEGRTPKAWKGLSLFKTGFGGRQIDYLPTIDKPISWKYYPTSAYERYLAWRRGV